MLIVLPGILFGIEVESSTKEIILIIGLVFYLLLLTVFTIYTTITHGYKAKYAEATKLMHSASHVNRDAYRYLQYCLESNEKIKEVFEKTRLNAFIEGYLTAVSTAFTLITGTSCRGSIKVIGQHQDDGEMFVRTLARDSNSTTQCVRKDEEETDKHKILKNTDYKLIFERKGRLFFK